MSMMYVVCKSPERRRLAQQKILHLLHEQGVEGDVVAGFANIDGKETPVYKIQFNSDGVEHENELIPQIENVLNGTT